MLAPLLSICAHHKVYHFWQNAHSKVSHFCYYLRAKKPTGKRSSWPFHNSSGVRGFLMYGSPSRQVSQRLLGLLLHLVLRWLQTATSSKLRQCTPVDNKQAYAKKERAVVPATAQMGLFPSFKVFAQKEQHPSRLSLGFLYRPKRLQIIAVITPAATWAAMDTRVCCMGSTLLWGRIAPERFYQ